MLLNLRLHLTPLRTTCVYFRNSLSTVEKKEPDLESKPRTKKKSKTDQPSQPKAAKEVVNYLKSLNQPHDRFPPEILQKTRKAPDSVYLATEGSARIIADALKRNLKPETPLLIANPGSGHLQRRLIEETRNDIFLYEPNEFFHPSLKNLIKTHPERKITLRDINLNSMWRLVHVDKLDKGNRVEGAMKGILRNNYEDDISGVILNMNGTLSFMKHIINSVIFQNGMMSYGRFEFFLCLTPQIFTHLTCSNKAGYMLYRSYSILFQLLFEYEIICKVNRKDFLPWQVPKTQKPHLKLPCFHKIDTDWLYFIRAVPRRDLHQYCPPEQMPALWFFITQHFNSRKNRIIPSLERWIPGCGIRLVLDSMSSEPPSLMNPNLDVGTLPELVEPCRQLSNEDFFDNINIYTEFGDLRPNEVLTLFNQFVSWPEHQESSFSDSLENILIKMHTNPEDNENEIETKEEDESKNGKSKRSKTKLT